VAEESGRLPEMCAVQAENYDEQARQRLSTLNKFTSVGIWIAVAAFIIMCIFNIFQIYYKSITGRFDPSGQPTLNPNNQNNQGQPPPKDVPDLH
jgi:hypothetical protein